MTETPLLYRFTVKCDRDTNRAIEKLAKACNMNVTAYVQRHFETIMGEERPGAPEPPPAIPLVEARGMKPGDAIDVAGVPFTVVETASVRKPKERKSRPSERIMAALIESKRPADGIVCLAQPALAQIAQTSIPTLLKYLDQMIKDGSVEIAREGQKGKPTFYRILKTPTKGTV